MLHEQYSSLCDVATHDCQARQGRSEQPAVCLAHHELERFCIVTTNTCSNLRYGCCLSLTLSVVDAGTGRRGRS